MTEEKRNEIMKLLQDMVSYPTNRTLFRFTRYNAEDILNLIYDMQEQIRNLECQISGVINALGLQEGGE